MSRWEGENRGGAPREAQTRPGEDDHYPGRPCWDCRGPAGSQEPAALRPPPEAPWGTRREPSRGAALAEAASAGHTKPRYLLPETLQVHSGISKISRALFPG